MTADDPTGISFPDVPKLELDELLDQLVDRAQGVKRAQGRLRALLRAIETIAQNLSLEDVLHNIVESARTLAHARYGALGVVSTAGGLERFVHIGMDGDVVARIGELPRGLGLLGALIADPQPIRLQHRTDDARSVGFPPGHPPMDSFLGTPILVRGEVFGNLYLTDSEQGAFSAEDEELVGALAMAAGTAISNARLYDESQRQQRWLSASIEISRQLLAATGEDPLRVVARHALDVGGADLAVVALLSHDESVVVVEEAFGTGADELLGRHIPVDETLSGLAVDGRQPLLFDSPPHDGERTTALLNVLDAGPLMMVPLRGHDRVRGVLTLVRRRGRSRFNQADLAMAAGFASHASVALELADSRAVEHRVALLEDRDRIARDLHDHVIQELFAIGLGLESVSMQLGGDPPLAQRVQQRVEDIDRTIRRIRTSIFELRGPLGSNPVDGMRDGLLAITADLAPLLGFSPHVTFVGLVDFVTDPDLVADVAAVVRESLTNVTKHARASAVSVELCATAADVTVTVTDDGVGIGGATRRSGVANVVKRAETRGGSCTITSAGPSGTTVRWSVPLP